MRRQLTIAVKVALAYLLYYTGVLRVWQSIALRNRAVVLMYHRVLTEDEIRRTGSHPGIIVTRDTFARHMAIIRDRFTVISAEQLGSHLAARQPLPNSACVITFDDGWTDNLTAAVPVLKALELPAIIFLPVNFIGQRRLFWRESLTHVVVAALQAARRDPSVRSQLAPLFEAAALEHLLSAHDPNPRAATVQAIAECRSLNAATAMRFQNDVEALLGQPVEPAATPDTFVTWDQVRQMAQDGIAFGGHGVEHRPLAEVSAGEAEREIREAMRVVRNELATPVLCFSYPNGSFTADVRELVKTAGYQVAFTTEAGFVGTEDDPFTLRRVNIHEDMTSTTPMFLSRVLGLL